MPGSSFCAILALAFLTPRPVPSAEFVNNPAGKSLEWSSEGARMFREARFEEARTAYSRSLALDPGNVQSHLGLGRIANLLSDSGLALKHFSAAYQLAPRDPDAILAFADTVRNPAARTTLFRNFLAYSNDPRTEDVRAKLQIAERTGADKQNTLASPYRTYRIPLASMNDSGLLLSASLNGGRDLKLILDTGATGVVLNASAARDLRLEVLADGLLSGFGSAKNRASHVARAATFKTNGFEISNLLLNVSEKDLTPQADGVIGLDVFKDFLIHLDARAKILRLEPQAEEEVPCSDCLRAYRLGSLLLVRGTVNGTAEGYFVLDSGSPYSMVSDKLVPVTGRRATFNGASGTQAVGIPAEALALRIEGTRLLDFRYATFDTTEISARNGTEIAGAIGFSVLRNLTLTIDYRAGLVGFGKTARGE